MNTSFNDTRVLAHPSARRLLDQITALLNTPEAEMSVVHALFSDMSAKLDKLRTELQDRQNFRVDELVEQALRSNTGDKQASTAQSRRDGAAFMEAMTHSATSRLALQMSQKEWLTSRQLQDALGVRRQSISEAVKTGRLFSVVGPSGENFYPAFYAHHEYDRRSLEKTSKALGDLPAASKYQFFTSPSHCLAGKTPLQALQQGSLQQVLTAAAGFAGS